MNSSEGVSHHLTKDDVLVACRVLLPDNAKLIDFKAENTMSSMLTPTTVLYGVTARLQQKDKSISEVKLAFKLPSLVPSVQKLSEAGGFFQREITFIR
jgi:hypothetical protein